MPKVKELAHKLVDTMPDDCTMEEILYNLYVAFHLKRGLDDVRAGRVTSQAEAEREHRKWKAKKYGGRLRRA